MFESAKFLLTTQFKNENHSAKDLARAQAVVQGAIQFVKTRQDELMELFENKQQMSSFSDNIPIIQPSLRWAQSPLNTFIEVKFSHRFDSPACLDIFDSEIVIKGNRTLIVSAMCRNDKKLLKYELEVPLYDEVYPFDKQVDPSVLEDYKAAMKKHEDAVE